jgi:IS30 family transposase
VALIARQRPRRSVRQDRWVPGPGRLTLADREEITLGVHAGESFTLIAAQLGKAASTVSWEVAAVGVRAQYRAWRAHQRAQQRARRPISQRPAEADDRAVPGHWEGDLLIGTDGRSAVGTLVERTTRYVLLLHLPAGRDAPLVEQAMRRVIGALPGELARTGVAPL